uniref:ADP-ribosylation factor-like protein 6-interacting protein 1 n=1 Tax=Phallusia mammillata TaxID=59560 RepID=A0A6F9D677_9ASCI|nr:ADP-ribosylation factor-like protein 6-interacting protein 1 [Phallusia mammillata]
MDKKSHVHSSKLQDDAENCYQDAKHSTVRRFLSNNKCIVVPLWNILMWREPYYAGVVFLCISAVFITLSFVNLSVVTTVALFISGTLFMQMLSDAFATKMESKYVDEDLTVVCDNIDQTVLLLKSSFMDLYELKQTNPVAFYITTIGSGLSIAWLGTLISTFLFVYISVLVIFAIPGLIHTGKLNPTDANI